MRGPLHAQGLIGRFDQAAAQEQTDPAFAAAAFAEISERLSADGFAPHADAIRRRAVQAYAAAGRRSAAARLQLQLVTEAIHAGRWDEVPGQVLVLQQVMDGAGDEVSAGLTGAVAALQVATTLLQDPVLSTDMVSAAVEVAFTHLEAMLRQLAEDPADFALLLTTTATIAVTVAEVAIATEASSVIATATGMFDRIIAALGSSSSVVPAHLHTRLRLAVAEAEDTYAEGHGRWTQLHQEAAGWNLDAKDAALVFGRYARAKAVGASPTDADAAWRRAVEFGGRAQLFSDTAGWLSAQWQLRHRYGPIDVKEIQELRQTIQLLAKQTPEQLIPSGDARLETLEALRRDDHGLRAAALAAQRLRILSIAAGLWEDEIQAHSLLADIFERSGEPSLAAFHRIRAAEAPSQDVASRVNEGFIDVTRELGRRGKHSPLSLGSLVPGAVSDIGPGRAFTQSRQSVAS